MIKLPDDKIVEQKKCRPREDRVSDPVKNGANKKKIYQTVMTPLSII